MRSRQARVEVLRERAEEQRNFTDPDSRIMVRGGSYLQGYNCQIVVDEVNQITLAAAVTNQAADQGHLIPMMNRVCHNTGQSPTRLSADAGYMSEDNAKHCMAAGIDAYISVGREKHQKTTDKTEPDSEKETWRTMRAKLQTKEGRFVPSRTGVCSGIA